MIRINGLGAVYGEVWYDEEPPRDSGVDIVLYRQRGAPIADAQTTPFLSLVTDLADGEDAIVAGFGKDSRYKISRAEPKEGLRTHFIHPAFRVGDDLQAGPILGFGASDLVAAILGWAAHGVHHRPEK